MTEILELYVHKEVECYQYNGLHTARVDILQSPEDGPMPAKFLTLAVLGCESEEDAMEKLSKAIDKQHESGALVGCVMKSDAITQRYESRRFENW